MKRFSQPFTQGLVATVFVLLSTQASALEKPLSVQKSLQQRGVESNARIGGAHGGKGPHARLSPQMQVQVALQHKARGRIGEAFISIDNAIRVNPDSAELYAVRGSFYMEQKNVSEALRDFEQALKLAPDSPAILTNRAQAYRHFGRIREALADLDRAIALKPDLLPAYFNRGSIYFSSQDYQRALQDFDRCIALSPHTAGPYFNRASTREALGDRQGAIADINRFLDITGNEGWKITARKLLDQWQMKAVDNTSDS